MEPWESPTLKRQEEERMEVGGEAGEEAVKGAKEVEILMWERKNAAERSNKVKKEKKRCNSVHT